MQALEPASLELRLEARPDVAAPLRRDLRTWLRDQGVTSAVISDVVSAVSEAFANAVEHPTGRRLGRIDVEARLVQETVIARVRDYGSWQTRRLRPGGNGFLLMRALMDAVELDCRPDGTAVTMRRQLRYGRGL